MTLERWLSIQDRDEDSYNFTVQRVLEVDGPDNEIVDSLAYELLIAHAEPERLRYECGELLNDIRYLQLDVVEQYLDEALPFSPQEMEEIEEEAISQYLGTRVFPDLSVKAGRISLITRIGNFGEALVAKYLLVFENFWFPIYKLRVREELNRAAKLTDLCLFKVSDVARPLVCYSEVKTHSSECNRNLGIEGHNSLVKSDALSEDPKIIDYIKRLLYSRHEYKKAHFVSDIQAGRIQYDKRYDLHLVHDADTWEESILNNLDDFGLDRRLVNFSVQVVLIHRLRNLIDSTYEHTCITIRDILNG